MNIKNLIYLIVFFIVIFFLCGCTDNTAWNKHPDNPILSELPENAWDHWRSDPYVMREGNTYKMWYGTNQNGSYTQIGYATSNDGINWSRHPEPVVSLGLPGSWDDEDVETPTVVKYNGMYHLWYCARGEPDGSDLFPDATYRIGHATSLDGIQWTKDPENPIIPLGNQSINEWDWAANAEPTVIVEDGIFKMWYVGGNILNDEFHLHIGYAISYDGSEWIKYDGNPVLTAVDYNGITTPSVVHSDIGYELWCTIFDASTGLPTGPIKYAFSPDGINWTMIPGIELDKGPLGEWDSYGIFGPTVLVDENEYKIWYSGFRVNIDFSVNFGIGYATKEKNNLHFHHRGLLSTK